MDLQNQYQAFQAAGAEVLAVAVHDVLGAQQVTRAAGATFPLLADPDHTTAEAYGVYNLLGDGLATPAVFIIDRSGRVTWSYVGRETTDLPTVLTILEQLPDKK